MKKMMSLMLGLTLVFGSAAFGADEKKAEAAATPAKEKKATAKKTVKKEAKEAKADAAAEKPAK